MNHLTSPPVNEKENARQFLAELHKRLLLELPSPSAMRKAIAAMLAEPKHDNNKHLRPAEPAFLNRYAVPAVVAHMQTVTNIGEKEAREALLSERYRCMRQYHRNSPCRL